MIKDQAHIGTTTLRGACESIADFLFAQHFTGNLALIEIKSPTTPLLEPKPYRGILYGSHRQLTCAMTQVLDQRSRLQMNFAAKSADPLLRGKHLSAVHWIVISGRSAPEFDETRSPDLFRNASRDVVVITFDELLAKLEEIHRLMADSAGLSIQHSSTSSSITASSDSDFSDSHEPPT